MDMTNESCRKFVEVLASNAPHAWRRRCGSPGGGCGYGLGQHGGISLWVKKYADVEEEIFRPEGQVRRPSDRAFEPGCCRRCGL